MKNTIRVSHNRVNKHPLAQGKITLESVRIGEAIGLSDQQIKALALLSEWEGQTPTVYCKLTALGYLQASFDDLQALAKADDRPKEKAWAQKFLPLVAALFPPVSDGKIPADAAGRSPAQSGKKSTMRQIPQPLAIEAQDSLALLEIAGDAALALAALNASHIKFCVKKFAGWEDFDIHHFIPGCIELVRQLDNQFKSVLQAWREELDCEIKNVEPAKSPADRPISSFLQMENIVNAIKHVVDMQGNEIGERCKNGSFAASIMVADHLEAAFVEAHQTIHKFNQERLAGHSENIARAA